MRREGRQREEVGVNDFLCTRKKRDSPTSLPSASRWQSDLCHRLFSRTVCRLLADDKKVCRLGSMPLPSTMADGKEADSSSGSWQRT